MYSSEFEILRAKHIAERIHYRDPDFPADKYAIRRDGRVSSDIKWKRPKEMVAHPKFITEGATRFDLDQGELGDCYFIAGAACISMYPRLFKRCVPDDQSFDDSSYARIPCGMFQIRNRYGIFHFYFYRFGEWKEVIIDDRLPTRYGKLIYAKNREEPNEFWAALLEKAYAKLHGSYDAINFGLTTDALVDMCGGISERIDLRMKKNAPGTLFELLQKMSSMQSMMGCSISASAHREEDLGNGMYSGHAYSITGVQKFNFGNRQVRLLRLLNPWGKAEWKGVWSDGSIEWKQISESDKRLLGFTKKIDGEFWMTFEDWLQNFHYLVFCHLYPDAHSLDPDSEVKKNWNVSEHYGEWIKGISAGGCGNRPYYELHWPNPQFPIEIKKIGYVSQVKTLIVSLMQMVEPFKEELGIGFRLFKVRNSYAPLSHHYHKYALEPAVQAEAWAKFRERTIRYDLPPGIYVVIPSTYHPHLESRFFLRLYQEI